MCRHYTVKNPLWFCVGKGPFVRTGISCTILRGDGRIIPGPDLHPGQQRSVGDVQNFGVGETHSRPDKCAFRSLTKGYRNKSNKNVFVFNN